MEANIFAPYIQLGFAGFAFLLVFVIVWLIRRLSVLQTIGRIAIVVLAGIGNASACPPIPLGPV